MTLDERLAQLEKAAREFNLTTNGVNVQGGFPESKPQASFAERLTHLEKLHDNFQIVGGANVTVEGSLRTGYAICATCPGEEGVGPITVGGASVTPCPGVETVTVIISDVTFDCGCIDDGFGGSFMGGDGDPFDPMAPGVNDTYILLADTPNVWLLDVFSRMHIFQWGSNTTCSGDPDGLILTSGVVTALCNPSGEAEGWLLAFNDGSGYAPFGADGIIDPSMSFPNELACNAFHPSAFINKGITTTGTATITF